MKRNINKIQKTILLSVMFPLYVVAISYGNVQNQHISNEPYYNEEPALDYVSNALVPMEQFKLTSDWTTGEYPLLLENGNSLWYSTQNDDHTWEFFDPEFVSIASGVSDYRAKKAIQLENGNIFVIDNKDGWYVYTTEGTLIGSGNSTFVDQREVVQMYDGTVVILGKAGAWTTLVEKTPGEYEVASSSSSTGVTIYAYSIVSAFCISETELFFANQNGGVGVSKYDPVTKSLSTNGVKYLDESHGEEWGNYSYVSSSIELSNGNILVSSDSGEYSILDLSDPQKIDVIYFNDIYDEDEMDNVSISTSVQIDNNIMSFTTGGDYFVTDINGNVLYEGESISEDEYFSGAIVSSDNSLYIGGDKYISEYLDGYSYANDIIDLPQTKVNILTYEDADGENIVSGVSTYNELIKALRASIVTEFQMPLEEEFSNITLYERTTDGTKGYSYEEITDLDSVWASDEISFKVSSNGSNPSLIEETEINTIDLEYSVAIKSLEPEYVSQTRAQINYEFFIPSSNPIVDVSLISKDGDVIATDEDFVIDPLDPLLTAGSFVIEDLKPSTTYEGYYIQIEYKESLGSLKPISTNESLEGSNVPKFKTLSDEIQIKDNRAVAQTLPSGSWHELDPTTGYEEVKIDFDIYDDGTKTYDPAKTKATIKETDKFGVVFERELFFEAGLSNDDPETIAKEVTATIHLKAEHNSTYSNLEIALNGDFSESISVPIYDENGQVLIHSRAPEESVSPNHFIFLAVIIILVTMVIILSIVATIVIYRKHHFHH